MPNSKHWNGDEYQRISLPQYQINLQFLNEHTFSKTASILDIGCGDGGTTGAIAQKAPEGYILGIDASNSMIDAAKKTTHHNTIKFCILNAQKINFREQFDHATCFFCMQWVPNKVDTFKRIQKSLKPGGDFLMVAPLPHPHLPKLRNKLIKKTHWQPYFKNYSDPLIYINDCDYKAYANTANLTVATYRVDTTPVIFPTYDDFFNFMHQMTPHLSCLPDIERKNEFLHELLSLYIEAYPPENGKYQLEVNLVKFRAMRTI